MCKDGTDAVNARISSVMPTNGEHWDWKYNRHPYSFMDGHCKYNCPFCSSGRFNMHSYNHSDLCCGHTCTYNHCSPEPVVYLMRYRLEGNSSSIVNNVVETTARRILREFDSEGFRGMLKFDTTEGRTVSIKKSSVAMLSIGRK
jgi:hypothetical protein